MSRLGLLRASAATFAIALVLPLSGASASRVEDAPAAVAARAAVNSARVLAISIDGLNPDALRELGRDGAPNFHRLLDGGASTLNARTEYEMTDTLPNHTGMVTGRRINRSKGGHGVTWNTDLPGTTVQDAAGHGVASVFSRVHKAGGSTALFASKSKFSLFKRSWPVAIDRFMVKENNTRLVRAARRDLAATSRSFTFLHLSLPDVTGHANGFMSPAYVESVARVDQLLGTVLRKIDGSPALTDNLVVVLTADHGGRGASHRKPRRLANYRVPFLAWGPGQGIGPADLYALNPDYREPGDSRPRYAGSQPVRNGDVANLSTELLGLGAVPGSELDRAQDLDVR